MNSLPVHATAWAITADPSEAGSPWDCLYRPAPASGSCIVL